MKSGEGESVAAPALFVRRVSTDHAVHGLFIPGFLFVNPTHCSKMMPGDYNQQQLDRLYICYTDY